MDKEQKSLPTYSPLIKSVKVNSNMDERKKGWGTISYRLWILTCKSKTSLRRGSTYFKERKRCIKFCCRKVLQCMLGMLTGIRQVESLRHPQSLTEIAPTWLYGRGQALSTPLHQLPFVPPFPNPSGESFGKAVSNVINSVSFFLF